MTPPSVRRERAALASALAAAEASSAASAEAAEEAALREAAARISLSTLPPRRANARSSARAPAPAPSVGASVLEGPAEGAPEVGLGVAAAPDADAAAALLARAAAEEDARAVSVLAIAEAQLLAASSAARLAAAQAQADVDLASALGRGLLSLLPTPSSLARRAATPDPSCEQQNIVAAASAVGIVSIAIAQLTTHRTKYPLIRAALLARAPRTTPARLSGAPPPTIPPLSDTVQLADFSASVLTIAAHAVKQQEHGLALLRAASIRDCALVGPAGSAAVNWLSEEAFDARAAMAIADGLIDLTFDSSGDSQLGLLSYSANSLDLCLGIIPLVQLALHIFAARHIYVPPAVSPLLALAKEAKFAVGGVLDPSPSTSKIFTQWSAASLHDDDVLYPHIYRELVNVLIRDAVVTGGESHRVRVRDTPTTWTAYCFAIHSAWEQQRGPRTATKAELGDLIMTITRFGDAVDAVTHGRHTVSSAAGSAGSFMAILSPPADPRPPPRLDTLRASLYPSPRLRRRELAPADPSLRPSARLRRALYACGAWVRGAGKGGHPPSRPPARLVAGARHGRANHPLGPNAPRSSVQWGLGAV